MKRILILSIILLSFGKTVFSESLTPEQFLETFSHSNKINRHYFGNIFLTIGLPVLGSSFFIEDKDNEVYTVMGGIYSGVGLLIKMIPSEVEMKAKEFKNKPGKTALERVVELKNSQKKWRYIGSALFALPLLLDLSGNKTELNPYPQDANLVLKTMLASSSIGMLVFKTPLEQLCSDVITGQESKLSVHFQPTLHQTNLSVAYSF